MHALHRPHLPHTVVVAVLAAVLAIILALASTGSVNDLRFSAPATGSSSIAEHSSAGLAAHASSFTANPFSSPVIALVAVPWATVGLPAASTGR